ncbi:MAG TPA: acetyl-CoA carboxylase biotin carboxylase subunit [Roseiarcus sp.]|nr:acetyl-CoA carboxylase biotin carboxylase subunit [Roseiarcus sp.]
MSAAVTQRLTPFRKILVANRGEIALRIMRTARRLGYGVVAVHSAADADALHAREADEAIAIGGAAPAQSYLRIEKIVAAAKASGADAIHPGYGFLAENAAFAAACEAAGLVFIGPSAAAIRAMGDKAGAKALMRAAGVACIPGYDGDQSEAALAAAAREIGFPLMIKASAGGGGRGMRLAPDEATFAERLRAARSEAQGAFGDATVLLERAIEAPRHIEIQVFADRWGAAIHLGERDCSTQRRHQKLIEEAPSPAVSPELRQRMGALAVAAVKAIGYEGAGTLEFLLDPVGAFYFMEMNTRLQVEHPVTEAVTGLDLVELQLRIASGERLPLQQEDVRFSGHAIEARLCAEDAADDFLPQSGRIQRWRAPEGLRVEAALGASGDISPYYDSMIAKIVSHGATREEALRKLAHGLDGTIAFGVATNQAFLAACLRHPDFVAGRVATDFVDRRREALLARPREALLPPAALAALLLRLSQRAAQPWRKGRALACAFATPTRIEIEGKIHDVEIFRRRDGAYAVAYESAEFSIEVEALDDETLRFRVGDVAQSATFLRADDRLYWLSQGLTFACRDATLAAPRRTSAAAGDGKLRAAMNGRVVAVLAKLGQSVALGQPLVALEAMKMEHVHGAPTAGIVAALHVAEGEQAAAGAILAEIEPSPAATP